jgi:hypothetical protein
MINPSCRTLLCLPFCLILFWSVEAHAEGNPTDILLQQASQWYGDMEFEKSLRLVIQASQMKGNSHAQLLRIYLILGLCYGSLGQYENARNSFARLLAIDPSYRLSQDISPSVRKPLEDVLAAKPVGLLVQLLPPPTAEIAQPITLNADVVSDPLRMISALSIYFKNDALPNYSLIRTKIGGTGPVKLVIPAAAWETAPGLKTIYWHLVVEDSTQGQLQTFGEASHPLVLKVAGRALPPVIAEQTPWYKRWWVWAILGGVVAVSAGTGWWLSSQHGSSGPFTFNVDVSIPK